MRIAWFSPFPPVRTGIAGRSAELVASLEARGYPVDRYPEAAAHDFPWRHRQHPYDLVIYQFGNSSHHDYEWPYALRYPGLVVLHDTRLHHARAALLLREKRVADYRAEFAWSEPDVSPDAAELAVAGFDSPLYYSWTMVRALVASSRLVAVHGVGARDDLIGTLSTPNSQLPTSKAQGFVDRIVSIRLGEGEVVSAEREAEARSRVRARYGINKDAIVFGCFGGMTPEKRLPQILAALAATRRQAPNAHLLLAGARAAHYDVAADIAAHGLQPHLTVAGYLENDADLTDHLAACDVSLNLRWPTARETSGPWLRALAAGRATIITDLVHLADVPSLDPRTWTVNARCEVRGARSASGLTERSFLSEQTGVSGQVSQVMSSDVASSQQPENPPPTSHLAPPTAPIAVAIDILDEDHSLRLAMRRLADDGALRAQLGTAAREWWIREHSVGVMVDDYERMIAAAVARPASDVQLPPHMRDDGDRRMREIVAPFGLDVTL
jgi:glycosyltransferase involved in cell wall biosynthesis